MVKKSVKWVVVFILFFIVTILLVDFHVAQTGNLDLVEPSAIQPSEALLILGARVYADGNVSRMLADRLDAGLALYQAGKASKIIVSGDHGKKEYDEVRAMCDYLEARGVKSEDIFMDHAGFSTYDSVYRAKAIFEVKRVIVVSQEYHTVRALYIAEKLGLEAQGVAADTYVYPNMAYYRLREVGARLKAFWMAGVAKPEPRFLGEVIPISGSGIKTRDY